MRSDRNVRCQFTPARIQRLLSAGALRGGFRCWGRGRAAQEQTCRHGPGEGVQQAPDVFFRSVPRSRTTGHCFFTTFSRRRVGLRGAQEPSAPIGVLQDIRRSFATPWLPRDRKPIFFGLPASRQRLFCGTGQSPPAPQSPLKSVPSSPGATTGARAFALPPALAARRASSRIGRGPGDFDGYVCIDQLRKLALIDLPALAYQCTHSRR